MFLSFMNTFSEALQKLNTLQMLFKIGALKNFAVLRIKKGLPNTFFPIRSSHVMLTY